MRKVLIMMAAGLMGLAGCSGDGSLGVQDHHADTPYGRYVVAREAALQGDGPIPGAVPVTLPREAPTPAQIGTRWHVPMRTTASGSADVPASAPRVRPARRAATGYADTQTVLTRYAAAMDNDPGETRFLRDPASSDTARNCAGFPTPEAAQIAFIARGGPQIDPLNLDPDGDGFVCGWDPRPLRATVR